MSFSNRQSLSVHSILFSILVVASKILKKDNVIVHLHLTIIAATV